VVGIEGADQDYDFIALGNHGQLSFLLINIHFDK